MDGGGVGVQRRRIMEAEGLEEESKAVPSPAVKEDNGNAEFGREGLAKIQK